MRPFLSPATPLPFAARYGSPLAPARWADWRHEDQPGQIHLTAPDSGLRLTAAWRDFPRHEAVEWQLTLANTGARPTPLIADIDSLALTFPSPLAATGTYRLHRLNGAPSNETDFAAETVELRPGDVRVLAAGGGRSSNRDFPFFTIETGQGTVVIAVGWSGQWQATLAVAPDSGALHVTAGLELTRFRLLPGEQARLPRMLALFHPGPAAEAEARFVDLIRTEYVPPYRGARARQLLFCNTCFTRNGAWLNECNEENQISLIRALQPLGVEAVITDAGWFTGGWPDGAGNWDPDPAKYPRGFGPVAAAAQECGMTYGLWFEPERVIAKTALHRDHPDWVLWRSGELTTGLLNFALPAAREYFLDIIGRYMQLPGFGVYRQDFNMDPLDWWRANDAPDRQGLTEIHYINGLYEFWDELARHHPQSLRESCASGGRRIDLETVSRFHLHQKSDFWFHNATDRQSLASLGRYLPRGIIAAPINRLDDETFESLVPCSLCLGWIADAPDFDRARAQELIRRFRQAAAAA